MILQKPAEATEDGVQGHHTTETVPVDKMDREQRALLVEQALETKDQDISQLLNKIQARKTRCRAWEQQHKLLVPLAVARLSDGGTTTGIDTDVQCFDFKALMSQLLLMSACLEENMPGMRLTPGLCIGLACLHPVWKCAFEDLRIEAEIQVGTRGRPTILNSYRK